MLYMVAFTINIPQMLAYIPYMDPMGYRHVSPMFLVKCWECPAMSPEGRRFRNNFDRSCTPMDQDGAFPGMRAGE